MRPARSRVLARRRRVLMVGGSVAVAGAALLVILGFLTARWIDARGNVRIYLHGPGVNELQEGALVAVDVESVGQVREVEQRDGKLVARLAIVRARAEQIPATSTFRVESLNHWKPGNVGVRVYVPDSAAGAEAIRDDALVRASDQFLPPSIPPRFYLLVFGALLMIAITVAIAVAVYKLVSRVATLIVVALGALILIGAYQYFDGQITPPQPPAEWLQTQVFE